ncbi:putative WRKY transcription factor 53 [Bidens hawaiensis]|uniref:putative WRKY transcription factor 53 n=1 Tax=Bidens hawaiensis TaxID=980011 RepID=UPI00404A1B7E
MDQTRVVTELTQGKEFAMQLKIHLDNASSSKELQHVLINSILVSYEKTLSLLTTRGLNPNASNNESCSQAGTSTTRIGSQVSFSESPCNEQVNREFKDPNHKNSSAKRKSNMEKWKNQVHVKGDMGVEEALDDGFDWRKYGQKDIFGAKHPRGYYRCTHRQLQGCLATKQVQKLDEVSSIFDVTYHGSHTCIPESQSASTPRNQSLQFFETVPASFYFPSSSNNLPLHDNTFDRGLTSSSTFSLESELRVERNRRTTNSDPALIDHVSADQTSTKSHTVDVGFSFDQMEFANGFNFDHSIFYNYE